MTCWICHAENADSREHRIKATDLVAAFGTPTPSSPLYFHTSKSLNKRVASRKADILKYEHRICRTCNGARTQPYDRAWDEFHRVLRMKMLNLKFGGTFRLNSIFRNHTRRQMLLVHLYFVKLFGCQIMEAGIPIDISTFSNAILEGESHPNIYLSFGRLRDVGFKNAGGSDVTVKSLKGKPIAAAWMYHIENMCVKVTYAAEGIKLQNLDRLYNPRLGAKQLLLEDFSD